MYIFNFLKYILKWEILKSYQIGLAIILSILSVFFEALGVSLLFPLFQFIENNGDLDNLAKEGIIWKTLLSFSNKFGLEISLFNLSIIVLSLITLRQIFSFSFTIYIVKLKQLCGYLISKKVFRTILSSKPSYIGKLSTGKFINIVDVQSQASATLIRSYMTMFSLIITFLSYSVVMISLSPISAVMALIISILIIFSLKKFVTLSRHLSHQLLLVRQKFSEFLGERFNAWKTIRIFGSIDFEQKNFEEIGINFLNKSIILFKYTGYVQLLTVPIISCFALIILNTAVDTLGLNLSMISLFLLFIIRLMPVSQTFTTLRQGIASHSVSMNNIINIIEHYREFKNSKIIFTKDKVQTKGLKLSNIFFNYSKNKKRNLINNFNAHFQYNSITLIRGSSGSGKSTLLDILGRFIMIEKGKIYLDGKDYLSLNEKTFQKTVTYISQTPFIFKDSILSNILYPNKNVSMKNVINVAKLSDLHDTVLKFDKGYNTLLDEGGTNISGGQRQRIALTRGLLKNSKIILLDEPTSALDYKSENIILKSLKFLSQKGKIIIVASHSTRFYKIADKIINLSNKKSL